LVVTFAERDQGVNVSVNEAPQMEAPHFTFNAQKFAYKYDVGSNGDKVGKALARRHDEKPSRHRLAVRGSVYRVSSGMALAGKSAGLSTRLRT